MAAFLLGGIIPLMINLSLHHFLLGSGPLLLSGQGGVNFYIGNSPTSQGFTAYLPGVGPGWDWTTVESRARYETNLPLKPADVDRHFWKKGWETIRADLTGWVRLLMRKAGLFWSRVEISNTEDLYHLQHSVPLLKILLPVGIPLMLPFAVWGGWRMRKIKEVKIMLALGGGFFLLSLLFFVNARYRYPIYPLLVILGSAGIKDVIGFITKREYKERVGDWGVGLLLTGLSAYLPFSTPLGFDHRRQEYGFFTEGVAWEKLGVLEKARRAYQEALDRNPATPYAHLSLARIAWVRKEGEKALSHCRQELEILPTNGRAWALMGMIKEEYGELGEALAAYRKALEYRPELSEIYPRAQTLIQILSRSLSPDDPRQRELLNFKAWLEHMRKLNGN
ncbi:MAG: tetratricopeptide repeat protein [bacterium]